MGDDVRRTKGGELLLDIAKYILTAVVVTSFVTERINLKIGLVGLGIGIVFVVAGIGVLPPTTRDAEKELR